MAGPGNYTEAACLQSTQVLGSPQSGVQVTTTAPEFCNGWILVTREQWESYEFAQDEEYPDPIFTAEIVAQFVAAVAVLWGVAWLVRQLVRVVQGR